MICEVLVGNFPYLSWFPTNLPKYNYMQKSYVFLQVISKAKGENGCQIYF